MPSMANITVKNAAAADVVYVAATPSSGDRNAARWRLNAASAIIGHRPEFSLTTRDNGSRNARAIAGSFKFPVVGIVDGVPTVLATVPLTFEGVLPTNVDNTVVADGFTQFGNLLVSALVRQSAQDGYAPT